MALIKVENLKFEYPLISAHRNLNFNGEIGGKLNTIDDKNSSISVLDGINFTFYEGDRVGLLVLMGLKLLF